VPEVQRTGITFREIAVQHQLGMFDLVRATDRPSMTRLSIAAGIG
jgi:hypothetical protein